MKNGVTSKISFCGGVTETNHHLKSLKTEAEGFATSAKDCEHSVTIREDRQSEFLPSHFCELTGLYGECMSSIMLKTRSCLC
jgi:hypothetical protein